MSQAANFTIKDGASTPADTVFTCVQPAGGNLPATYFARAKGSSSAYQPKIAISSKGGKKIREVFQTVLVPYSVVDGGGKPTLVDNAYAEIRVVLPDTVPDSVRSDLRAYVANSVDVAQIVDAMITGYAPN